MNRRTVLLLSLAVTASIAGADQRQRPTFMATTSYQSCQKTWAFACGMRDASGHTYGTAHEQEICSSYTFHPDGTFTTSGLGPSEGTYRIFAGKVTMTTAAEADVKSRTFELTLSPDGTMLGGMKRLPR